MKKLKKINLTELTKSMPIISEKEQREYVGGDTPIPPWAQNISSSNDWLNIGTNVLQNIAPSSQFISGAAATSGVISNVTTIYSFSNTIVDVGTGTISMGRGLWDATDELAGPAAAYILTTTVGMTASEVIIPAGLVAIGVDNVVTAINNVDPGAAWAGLKTFENWVINFMSGSTFTPFDPTFNPDN